MIDPKMMCTAPCPPSYTIGQANNTVPTTVTCPDFTKPTSYTIGCANTTGPVPPPISDTLYRYYDEPTKSKPLQLHLGCFKKHFPGFINVDIRPDVEPDLVDDVFKLEKVENDSVDLVYSSHVLEHSNRKQSMEALTRWHQVLKPGGVLRISVPDLEAVFAAYFYHQDLRLLQNFLYGSQKHDYDFHYTGWDFKTLKEDLESVGFKDVHRYDWKTTPPHDYIDDYSRAYIPHMDFARGKLMSLNVEGVK